MQGLIKACKSTDGNTQGQTEGLGIFPKFYCQQQNPFLMEYHLEPQRVQAGVSGRMITVIGDDKLGHTRGYSGAAAGKAALPPGPASQTRLQESGELYLAGAFVGRAGQLLG